MISFIKSDKPKVTDAEMEQIYEKVKTPKKFGPVMKWENDFTDSPTVFYENGKYYMYFIAISKDCNKSGYETHLAKSDDLLNWEYIGPIFKRNELDNWDSKQCAGYAAFSDIRFEGSGKLDKVNGHNYISYLGGNSNGYEPDPLFMGLAKTDNPTDPNGFVRFKNPILRPDDKDIRPFETKTLYKSFMFRDPLNTTGFPYVNIYNAKDNDNRERLFLAVSQNGENWERYGEKAALDIITEDEKGLITGDPQIMLIDDIYVCFFFRHRKWYPAFNTFACSRDLVHWTVWEGKPLVESEFIWEQSHAHKTWFIRVNGKNYHFYCAVNEKDNERFIALATS